MTHNHITPQKSQFLIYQAPDGQVKIDVRFDNNDVWLSQKLMAELFGVSKQNISLHIQNIVSEGEIDPKATVKEYLTVQIEGNREVSRSVEFYNLDMIISVGYRVSSKQATQFRIRATTKLKEYIVKGFVLDDERLKQSGAKSIFFQELLQRIRDIRSSERNLYQKVTDIFATSIDYDPKQELTQQFFATVQNKMIFQGFGSLYGECKKHYQSYLEQQQIDSDLNEHSQIINNLKTVYK